MSSVPATVQGGSVSEFAARNDRGRAGMLLLILGEISFFAVFLVAYLFYIGKSLGGPYPADVLDFPVFGTICLLSSSFTITIAVRDLRRGEVGRFAVALFVTLALGAAFLVLTASECKRAAKPLSTGRLWLVANSPRTATGSTARYLCTEKSGRHAARCP